LGLGFKQELIHVRRLSLVDGLFDPHHQTCFKEFQSAVVSWPGQFEFSGIDFPLQHQQ
jgi:hypothetical protein